MEKIFRIDHATQVAIEKMFDNKNDLNDINIDMSSNVSQDTTDFFNHHVFQLSDNVQPRHMNNPLISRNTGNQKQFILNLLKDNMTNTLRNRLGV